MRKILTILMLIGVMSLVIGDAHAQTVYRTSRPSLMVGGGVNANMYHTASKFETYSPSMVYGIGLPTNSGFLGGVLPDETYIIGQFVRTKIKGVDDHIGTYTASLAGVWYLEDTMNFWQPFIVVRTNFDDVVGSNGGSTIYLNGQLGLGLGCPISSRSAAFVSTSVKLGEDVNADLLAGIRVNL